VKSIFAGHVEEMQFLFRCLACARQRDPRLVLLEGPMGSGRSALLSEFARRLAEQRDRCVYVHVSAPVDGVYDPVEQAAREATNKQFYDRVGGRRRAMESARALLPDWLAAVPVIGELMAAIVGTIQTLRRRRRKASTSHVSSDDGTDALIDVAARRPLVLLLDDLERVDRTAAAHLEMLLRSAVGRAQLLVVGACRTATCGTSAAPAQAMAATLPNGMLWRRVLPELTSSELAAWLRKRFPHVDIPASFLEWLHDRTGGHPAAVERMLDRLLTRSVIRFVNRRWEVGAIPADLEVAPAAAPTVDLSGISLGTVELLEAASSLGLEFDSVTLSRLVERDELYVEDQLAQALRHAVIQADGETEVDGEIATLYRFRSVHLRSALFHALSAERRAELTSRHAGRA
jgi:predicted ATPase